MNIPLAVNFTRDGVVTRVGNREPELCAHAGESWSTTMGVRCSQCGCRLFAAPSVLAFQRSDVVESMYRVWQDAGWPVLNGWPYCASDNWVVINHPLFAHIGGIPVRRDKLPTFAPVGE